jgi:esterase/lipase superfamily enzyme
MLQSTFNPHHAMRREIARWFTERLNKEMEVVAYGHFGFAVLMIPSAGSDFLEYERRGVIEALRPLLEGGACKLYVVNSIMNECWLNERMPDHWKGIRHHQYNEYLVREVVPFIINDCGGGPVPIYTSGVSLGATLSANLFFKYPDFFAGTLSLSGSYDIAAFTRGYFDEYVHHNSPIRYLADINDEAQLGKYRGKKLVFATGQGQWERPEFMLDFCRLLDAKKIPHTLDLWGHDIPHDWESWQKMYPYFLSKF